MYQGGKQDTATCVVKLGLAVVANVNGAWIFFFFQVSVFKSELKCLKKKDHSSLALVFLLHFTSV